MTIDDLNNPAMDWVPYHKALPYTEDITGFQTWYANWERTHFGSPQYSEVLERFRIYFSRISLRSGIDTDSIENFYFNKFPQLQKFWNNSDVTCLNSESLVLIYDSFLIPDIDKYIEKLNAKSPKERQKEELLTFWHEYSLDEQKIILLYLIGLFGAGANNINIRREWRKRLDYKNLAFIDTTFDALLKNIQQKDTDTTTKEKALYFIKEKLKVRQLSVIFLSEIIEQFEEDYEKVTSSNPELFIPDKKDTTFTEIILLLKTILKYQQIYDLDCKRSTLNQEANKALSDLRFNYVLATIDTDTVPLLSDASPENPDFGDEPGGH